TSIAPRVIAPASAAGAQPYRPPVATMKTAASETPPDAPLIGTGCRSTAIAAASSARNRSHVSACGAAAARLAVAAIVCPAAASETAATRARSRRSGARRTDPSPLGSWTELIVRRRARSLLVNPLPMDSGVLGRDCERDGEDDDCGEPLLQTDHEQPPCCCERILALHRTLVSAAAESIARTGRGRPLLGMF